jgi:hypothetical protein
MANSTSTFREIGTELGRSPGHEHGTLTAWIQDLIFTVDHQKIGLMYIGMAWLFFIPAGILASLIRAQLAVPNNHVLGPEAFNEAFTMHGTAMIFFFAMPMWFGVANYPGDWLPPNIDSGLAATHSIILVLHQAL